jgi:hypothetical protein
VRLDKYQRKFLNIGGEEGKKENSAHHGMHCGAILFFTCKYILPKYTIYFSRGREIKISLVGKITPNCLFQDFIIGKNKKFVVIVPNSEKFGCFAFLMNLYNKFDKYFSFHSLSAESHPFSRCRINFLKKSFSMDSCIQAATLNI